LAPLRSRSRRFAHSEIRKFRKTIIQKLSRKNMTTSHLFDLLLKLFFGGKTLFTNFCIDPENNRILVVYAPKDVKLSVRKKFLSYYINLDFAIEELKYLILEKQMAKQIEEDMDSEILKQLANLSEKIS
jgi:hypothetical protein